MQAATKAVETVKETAANIGASAKSGLEKTKATVQEKTERIGTDDPIQKDMATHKKEERIHHAEMEKQKAREQNAAAKQSATAGHVTEGHHTTTVPGTEAAAYSTTGEYGQGQPMGTTNQMSPMPGPGHGHGQEEITGDVVGTHPIGTNTAAHNAHLGGTGPNY